MKVETRDGAKERRILLGMATDSSVLARLAPHWAPAEGSAREGFHKGPLATVWGNLVGSWCIEHFTNRNESPGQSLIAYYESWLDTPRDKEVIRSMEEFLSELSDEGKAPREISSELLVEKARDYLNEVKVRRHIEACEAELNSGKVNAALERIAKFIKTDFGDGLGEDLLLDEAEVRSTFAEADETLIRLQGGLGKFVQSELARDSFVAFQAPEKTGKSFLLQELAWQAILQKRRVAFFEAGDMSRRQIKRRFMSRLSQKPFRSPDGEWPYSVNYPVSLKKPGEGDMTAAVEFEPRVFKRALDGDAAWEACRHVMKYQIRSKRSYLKLCCHPAASLSVAGIRSKLKIWEGQGWTPDVVVVDYADILAPPSGCRDPREGINATWLQLRGLSTEKHCLVLTATQASRESYDKPLQSKKYTSEDKRKLSHVTGLIGMSVTGADKDLDVMRLNWLVARDIDFSPSRLCYVVGCRPLANPCVLSSF